MSIQTVRATVVDIKKDVPQPSDELFVDTNSWRTLTYTRLLNTKPHYPDYLKTALANKTVLYACGITLVELASSIENDEWNIYRDKFSEVSHKKAFRHTLPAERERVVAEVKASWDQVKQMATLVDLAVDTQSTERCMNRFLSYPIDGNDLLLVDAMDRKGITNILTDDCDFAALPGVRVFTANSAVLAAARNQQKLTIR